MDTCGEKGCAVVWSTDKLQHYEVSRVSLKFIKYLTASSKFGLLTHNQKQGESKRSSVFALRRLRVHGSSWQWLSDVSWRPWQNPPGKRIAES